MTQLTDSTPTDAKDYLDESFSKWLLPLLEKHHVPGYSVAVISNGKVNSTGYGLARLPNTPATSDTLYPMCSTTKAFTAALVGMCIEEAQKQTSSSKSKDSGGGGPAASSEAAKLEVLRKKGWKTAVRDVLPDFVASDPYVTQHATLEDIASHRSGIAGHDLIWGPWLGSSVSQATRIFRHLEPVGEDFRSKFQYNNLLYATLGDVVETVLGKSYNDALHEKVLEPLCMSRTWVDVARAKEEQATWARGYYWRALEDRDAQESKEGQEKGYYLPEKVHSLLGVEPAGALISSVDDYAKWVVGLLAAAKQSNSEASTEKIDSDSRAKSAISPSVWRQVTTPRIQYPDPYPSTLFQQPKSMHARPDGYAFGWVINDTFLPGHLLVQHGGGLPGISTLVAMLPDHDFGIVLAANANGGSAVNLAVAKELFGRRIGMSEEDRRRHLDPEKKKEDKGDKQGVEDLEPKVNGQQQAAVQPAGNAPTFKLHGKYFNAAYGTFQFEPADASASLGAKHPSLNGIEIVRPKPKAQASPSSSNREANTNSISPPTILVTPMGRRGLHYQLLLHPSPAAQPHASKILYRMETLFSHGNLSQDEFPELDPGWGDPNDSVCPGPPEKGKAIWESGGVKSGGLAVGEVVPGVRREDGDGDQVVWRVGMRLLREDGGGKEEEGGLEEGWEERRMWFTRVWEEP
ncbi:uncharacterized protein HMPREF1541_09742 [Cyphellophora europaea CBS 101466]|uniref:Beta-lactamase-related domain-containing protein n=1 Tax=Cyphellophora europaea (strain CBS 101466) TaxID=1220924 RepID=W2S878_CYPE1|nr:uncharacterized protein HMPREF1541_09742 [Cyphellophora europaea CBS 101466]ETN44867.1 hypothetical protein HMPREF1541_09742 [Cyphellophora europaea CBS 101466]